jgi:hypothetical protein
MEKKLIPLSIIAAGLLFTFAAASSGGNNNSKPVPEIKTPGLIVTAQHTGSGSTVRPALDFGRFPLYFITNKGQVHERAVFYAKTSKYTLWLTKEGLVFDSIRHRSNPSSNHLLSHSTTPQLTRINRDVSRLIFLNSRINATMVPIDESKLRVNYFIGKYKSNWHCNVPTSLAVLYKGLYKNVDLKVHGIEKQIEYDWIVKPDGDPGDIRFTYKNVKGTRIDEEGNLLIETDFGKLMHKKPVSYQTHKTQDEGVGTGLRACPEERKYVDVTFKKIGKNTYGFSVGKYDKTRELVIDPVVLAYSTYLGGDGNEFGQGIAVDGSGSAYVTGFTYSSNFPVSNRYQDDQIDIDAFVTRIDTTRSGVSSLVYSTYLGGDGRDYGMGIAVDGSGIAYAAGLTLSANFPTQDQYQDFQGVIDAFITKIDTTRDGASSLVYSTCLGGSGGDAAMGIAVDSSGFAYVTGYTSSSNFPVLNQYQGRQGSSDVFVTKIDTTQSGAPGLLYSTYLGGTGDEYGRGIAADNSGSAYVTGEANINSTDFPILNGYQGNQPERDVFVTRIDTTLSGNSSLIYSTYLGGDGNDYGHGIAADNSGGAYVTGETWSTDFPTRNQYQTYPGDGFGNAFVTRIDTTRNGNSSLIYSTYLGGGSLDIGHGIAAGNNGNVYVGGITLSSNFPLLDQYQAGQGGLDAFITKIDTGRSGVSSLICSTHLGGSSEDRIIGIAIDNSGGIYLTGYTNSPNFPTLNQYQTQQTGYCAFVTKLSEPTSAALAAVTTAPVSSITTTSAAGGGEVTDDGGAAVTARGVCWSLNPNPTIPDSHTVDGAGTGPFTSSLTGLIPGTTYYVRAYATNNQGTAYGNGVTFTTFVNPTISGTVFEGNDPLKDVTITFSHNGHTETTGVNGYYSYTTAYGISTEVTASKQGYTFTPERYLIVNLTANRPNRDFTAVKDIPVDPPHIVLNRTRLNYGSIIGGAQTGSQTLLIENSGGGVLDWNASVSDSWIEVTPVTGAENMLAAVSVDANGLAAGSYKGAVSIIDDRADNSPAAVDIYLEVKEIAQETPPMGIFDAPTDGSIVYSAVPVTGWAIDDTEVKSIKIYRDPIPGHETDQRYIGDALLVEGARPDVETRFNEHPKNYLAGWSYMMLTNHLPNNGNGTFVITAVVTDNSGNEVTLGSKTITCDNAHAVKPFGAIDTPMQGGDASGKTFVNFGWALTPPSNTIPKDGSTINVWVDGVPLTGNPVYNLYRQDIAVGFPGYNNSNGAVGYYILDTTLYTNGIHTISWSVTDDAGNTDNIGSRYFRVMNVVNPSAGSASSSQFLLKHREIPPLEKITDKEDMITMEIKECQRIKVNLWSGDSTGYAGFLVVSGRLRPLPVGSFLDTSRGVFYWQAGGGFIGTYRFVFIKRNRAGEFEKKKLKVVIHPGF